MTKRIYTFVWPSFGLCQLAVIGLLTVAWLGWARWAGTEDWREAPRVKVVLDPGHGGNESGLILKDGAVEKNLTLALAQEFQRYCKAKKKSWEVTLTRTGDVAMNLLDRATLANRQQADVFISVHVQSESHSTDGWRIYVNQFVKAAALSKLAQREIQSGITIVPWELAQNSVLPQSRQVRESLEAAGLRGKNKKSAEESRSLPVHVLTGVRSPAVMIELPASALSSSGRQPARTETVRQLAEGIQDFLARR